MSFSGRKFSINRHTGAPKTLTRRFSTTEPSMNGKPFVSPLYVAFLAQLHSQDGFICLQLEDDTSSSPVPYCLAS